MVYSLGGLLLFVLDIYVIYLIITSSMDSTKKLLWIIVVLLLPLIGPLLYLLIARNAV